MNYYIIAGEASGDLHASNLMKALARFDAKAAFRCWGGDLMQHAGGTLVKHYKELAYMGFIEVAKNIRTILKNIELCKNDLLAYQPETLILVDYPGFNLRIAPFAKKHGIPVIYYISPQVWAWHSSRVKKIRDCVDKMLVIFPFEIEFYKKWEMDVGFTGHPLPEVIDGKRQQFSQLEFYKKHGLDDRPIIALLPGSRRQEIKTMLPLMIGVKDNFKECQMVIAGAPSVPRSFYAQLNIGNIPVVENNTYELLHNSTAALVTSGTATLETALFGVPQVVCYKGNSFSYFIAKRLVNVNYICIVNLILNKPVVKELIQDELCYENIKTELNKILENNHEINQMKSEYLQMKKMLGGPGASERAAQIIVSHISKK